jgi:hypothetical protein
MAAARVTGMKIGKRLRFDAETVENEGSRKENKANASQVTPFEQPLPQPPYYSSTSPTLSPLAKGSPHTGFDSDATEEQKAPPSFPPVVKLLDKFDAAGSEIQVQVYDIQISMRLSAIAVMEKHKQSRQEKNLSVIELDRALDKLRNNAPTLLDISLRPSSLTAEDEARLAEEDKISSEKLRRHKREWAESGREFGRKLAKFEQRVNDMIASEDREVAYLVAAEEARKEDTTW